MHKHGEKKKETLCDKIKIQSPPLHQRSSSPIPAEPRSSHHPFSSKYPVFLQAPHTRLLGSGIPQGFPRRFAFVLRTPRNSFLLGVPPVASATMYVDLMSRIKAKQVLLGIPQHCRLTSVSLCIFLVHSSLRFASLRSLVVAPSP